MNGLKTIIFLCLFSLIINTCLAENITIGSDKQLFIDFSLIEKQSGVKLVLNPPVKKGVVISPDKPWENIGLGAYGEVMEDNGIYRMWYETGGKEISAPKDSSLVKGSTCYAVSKDGLVWEKPLLNINTFNGNTDNNIVFPFYHHGTVFKDPTATPDKRYKTMVYNDEIVYQHSAYSPDGIHDWKYPDWKLYYLTDSQNMAFWDDQRKKYILYFRGWTKKVDRTVVRVETDDFLSKWPIPDPGPNSLRKHKNKWAVISDEIPVVIKTDKKDPDPSDFYNPCVVKYPLAPNVYFAFPSMFFHLPEPPMGVIHTDKDFISSNGLEPPNIHIPRHYNAPASPEMTRHNVVTRNSGFLDVRFMSSRDGINWNREHRSPYITLGSENEPDSGSMYMFVGMIIKGAVIYQYYSGYKNWHSDYEGCDGVIMMAEQRLDGFVSADSDYQGGEIVTKPFIFKGNSLHMNINTSAIGSAAVSILDSDGKPFPGFNVPDCDVIRGNFIDKTVTWGDKSDLSKLEGKQIKLRILSRDSKLYSLQFK